jgi:hypothetical protein
MSSHDDDHSVHLRDESRLSDIASSVVDAWKSQTLDKQHSESQIETTENAKTTKKKQEETPIPLASFLPTPQDDIQLIQPKKRRNKLNASTNNTTGTNSRKSKTMRKVKRLQLDKARKVAAEIVAEDSIYLEKMNEMDTSNVEPGPWTPQPSEPDTTRRSGAVQFRLDSEDLSDKYAKQPNSPSIDPRFKQNMKGFNNKYKLVNNRRNSVDYSKDGLLLDHPSASTSTENTLTKVENDVSYSLISANPHQVYTLLPEMPSYKSQGEIPYSFKKTTQKRLARPLLPHELAKMKPKMELVDGPQPLLFEKMSRPSLPSKAQMFNKLRYRAQNAFDRKPQLKADIKPFDQSKVQSASAPVTARGSHRSIELTTSARRPVSAASRRSLNSYLNKNLKNLEQRNVNRHVLRDAPSPDMLRYEHLVLSDSPPRPMTETSPNSSANGSPLHFIEITGQQTDISPSFKRNETVHLRRFDSSQNLSPNNKDTTMNPTDLLKTFKEQKSPTSASSKQKKEVTFKQPNFSRSTSHVNMDKHTHQFITGGKFTARNSVRMERESQRILSTSITELPSPTLLTNW